LETFGLEAGKQVATADERWEERAADEQAAQRLGVAVGDRLLQVERLKTVDGTPVGWFVDTVAESAVPFDLLRAEFRGAVIDVLLAHPEFGVAYEDADFEPVNLGADIASRLGVKRGTAALQVDAVTLSTRGIALEWAQFWLLSEHLRFSVRRRPQVGRATF
jgi:DNA-binding GntR family transcriptional regulator